MKEGISVIICCYNSEDRLLETLRHLAFQKTGNTLLWEIILVDNASTDHTGDAAVGIWRDLGRTETPLTIVHEPVQGLSFARARGVATARYSVLVFCDDDNWLQSNYLTDAYTIMQNANIGAIGGTGMAVSDGDIPEWFDKFRYCFACYAQGKTDGELTEPLASLYGAGMVVRHEALIKLADKKFKPILTDRQGQTLMSGGDTELCYALKLMGYKLWFSDKLRFHHYLPARRLTKEYLNKLNRSLAYCSGSLIVYKYVLTNKPMTPWLWIKDATWQVIFLGNSVLRFLKKKESRFNRKMDIAFSFNRMKSILCQFGKYRLCYNRIAILKH